RLQKALCGRAVEYSAFLERGKGVRRQHLRPLVAVVAGGVPAGEDVAEAVRKAVPLRHRHDGGLVPDLAQQLLHASAALGRVLGVEAEVEQGEFQLPHHLQPRVEAARGDRSEEHTSELQSQSNLVCRLLLEKKNNNKDAPPI